MKVSVFYKKNNFMCLCENSVILRPSEKMLRCIALRCCLAGLRK